VVANISFVYQSCDSWGLTKGPADLWTAVQVLVLCMYMYVPSYRYYLYYYHYFMVSKVPSAPLTQPRGTYSNLLPTESIPFPYTSATYHYYYALPLKPRPITSHGGLFRRVIDARSQNYQNIFLSDSEPVRARPEPHERRHTAQERSQADIKGKSRWLFDLPQGFLDELDAPMGTGDRHCWPLLGSHHHLIKTSQASTSRYNRTFRVLSAW
jgi:hypothetical protein